MILVTGASGNIGRNLVPQLAAAGGRVRALVRDPSKAPAFPPGVEVVAGDLGNPESLRDALAGVERVFLLLPLLPGVRVQDYGTVLAEIEKSGVRHVLFLSSVNAASGPENVLGEMNRAGEKAVKGVDVAWTFLRVAAFHSNALGWADTIRTEGMVRARFKHFRSSSIDPRDIASAATLALMTDEHMGRTHVLTGPEALTVVEQVAVLGDALGKPLELEELGWERALALMVRKNPPNEQVVRSLLTMEDNNDHYLNEITTTFEDITGRPPFTFRQWVVDHIDTFR